MFKQKTIMANSVGRPRTTTPPEEDVVKLGQELVTWASDTEAKEIRCRFAQWYSIIKGITHKQWDLLLQKPEFRGYYEKAQTILGQKYLDGTIRDSIAHRFLRRYVPEIKHQENEDLQDKLDRELDQKKKLAEYTSQKQDIPPFDDIVDRQNQEMSENYRLRKEIELLKAQLDHKS